MITESDVQRARNLFTFQRKSILFSGRRTQLPGHFLGLFVEYEWGPHVSLVVFLALYFVFLWVAWQFAVRLSKPRVAEQAAA